MGLFKQMKQMKDVVAEAPGLIENAQAMQRAQAMQAQTLATSQVNALSSGSDLDAMEVGGVSLRRYAEICRTANGRNLNDQEGIAGVAAEMGVERADWDAAANGWMDVLKAQPHVAQRFNVIWRGLA